MIVILLRTTVGLAAAVLAVLTVACTGVTPATSTLASGPSVQPSPPIVTQWAAAWNENRPADMAALFTSDAVYDDLAFQASWRGPDQVAQWVSITHNAIDNVDSRVDEAFRSGDRIAVTWTFSGQLRGAPRAFSVPATTVMQLRDDRIVRNRDYYNLSALLQQSGLPADWSPPGG